MVTSSPDRDQAPREANSRTNETASQRGRADEEEIRAQTYAVTQISAGETAASAPREDEE